MQTVRKTSQSKVEHKKTRGLTESSWVSVRWIACMQNRGVTVTLQWHSDLVHFVDSASALQPFTANPAFDDLESALRAFVSDADAVPHLVTNVQ